MTTSSGIVPGRACNTRSSAAPRPVWGLVGPEDYREDVKHTVMFLEGRNEEVIRELTAPMQKAADGLDYERAAQYRDQIISLRKIQENQYITAPRGELDIVACYMEGGYACVQVFFIRGGLNLGNKAFFPGHTGELGEEQVLNAFCPSTTWQAPATDRRRVKSCSATR